MLGSTRSLRSLRVTCSVGLLSLLVASGACSTEGPPPVKHILLVSIDTLRADHLGSYGYFRDTSPVIDSLVEDSIFFERCLTPLSTTLPAHTSLLTATHPLEHGILANLRHGGKRFTASPALRSFAEIAQEQGFRTAAFVSAAPVSRLTGIAAGFEVFDEPASHERPAASTNERVFEWIDRAGEGPFFLWVHYFDPHAPYRPPDPFADFFTEDAALEAYVEQRRIAESVVRPNKGTLITRSAINAYDDEIRYVDQQLGRLIQRFVERGLWDETALILLSDHGEGFGEHGMSGHGYIHGEQIHVPLMMRIPGLPGRRVPFQVSLVDVLPTALALLDREAGWEDFLGQASGRNVLAAESRPRPVLSQRTERQRDDLVGPAFALSTERWKYVHEPEREDRLFDWSSDPLELRDLVASEAATAARLRSQLLEQVDKYEARGRELGRDEAPDEPMDPELIKKLQSLGYVD